MRTRRFLPVMESLSSRIVPSDLGTLGSIVGGVTNPMSPPVGTTDGTAPGTLPLTPPYCGGGTATTGSGTTTVLIITPSAPVV
jgi:hypothetical protein